jgi:uncharacterized protein (TIGR00645 family)
MNMHKLEDTIERGLFASRWFMAPIYVVLSITLGIIAIKSVQEFIHIIPSIVSMSLKDLMLYILHIVDLALIGNLVLMIIFAGYENFVSKINVARESEDKPSWMGKVDFSELKLKLIASIVAISGINLLETFMNLESVSEREIYWMCVIHILFVVSGVLLATMDYIASKSRSH